MKLFYLVLSFAFSSCGAFDKSQHYFTDNTVLIIHENDAVRIENTLFKDIYSDGTVLSRDGEKIVIQIISYKPQKAPQSKTIQVELLPKQQYRYIK